MGLLGVWRLAHYRCEEVSALKGREREEDSSSVLTERLWFPPHPGTLKPTFWRGVFQLSSAAPEAWCSKVSVS